MIAIAFRFRFQRLLDVREAVERQRMQALSVELARKEEALAALHECRSRLDRSEDALRVLYQASPLAAPTVQREHAHRKALQAWVIEAEERVKEAARRVEDARSALIEATRERRVMEKLRERHEAAYWAEQDRREQAELDEIGLRLGERRASRNAETVARGESRGA